MNIKDFEYVTITAGPHWFYGSCCEYPLICPTGTKVKFLGTLQNWYGYWFEVEYEGKRKYIFPQYYEGNVMVKRETRRAICADPLAVKLVTIFTDRYRKHYRLVNEKGDLELI